MYVVLWTSTMAINALSPVHRTLPIGLTLNQSPLDSTAHRPVHSRRHARRVISSLRSTALRCNSSGSFEPRQWRPGNCLVPSSNPIGLFQSTPLDASMLDASFRANAIDSTPVQTPPEQHSSESEQNSSDRPHRTDHGLKPRPVPTRTHRQWQSTALSHHQSLSN